MGIDREDRGKESGREGRRGGSGREREGESILGLYLCILLYFALN
jgi:hypothetical protein